MKKMSYFVLVICSFIIFTNNVFGKEIVVINGYDVRLRREATTGNNNIISSFNVGMEFDLIDKNIASGNGCNKVWYKVEYNNGIGYVCSEFANIREEKEIDISDYAEYSDYLKELGFPQSYISSLVVLHTKYPKWQFKPLKVNQKFDTIVNLEYDGYSKGWSLIEDYYGNNDGYKSFDSWSYNYLTDVFSTNFVGGGSNWYAAGKKTIAYYLDPRNFLNESRIFMFETLSYNKNYHTVDGVNAMLKGTFMSEGYADEENKKTFADAFIDAGIKYNVSPYVLASRVIQEVSASRSTIVSGTVKDYEGYYNFYNIGAYGSNSGETIRNGLEYAKKQGWNNQYKAIVGGATFLADDYFSQGQDTLYLQKWDLIGSSYVTHQYMQNIEAPYTESYKTYNGYKNIKLLDSDFMFVIPVLNDMPDKTSLPNKGNPNNYLSSLSVNGSYLFEKAGTKQEYDLNLDESTKTINIAVSKVNDKATVIGSGSVAINNKKMTVPITVRAENGDERVYKINITVNDIEKALDISEILNVLNIKNDGSYISSLKVGYKYQDLVKLITDKESKATVTYLDKNSKDKTTNEVASLDILKIKTDHEEKTYKIIIYGDVNSDSKIGSADYIAVKNHIMNVKKLSIEEEKTADVNKDGKVNSADYIAIKNHIMNVKEITQ